MPFGGKVQCFKCNKNESFMWHQVDKGVQCNDCYERDQHAVKNVEEEEPKPAPHVDKPKSQIKKNSKTTRNYKTRQNPNAVARQVTPKGRGRRHIFKKSPPTKLHGSPATITTHNHLVYKGQQFQVGDIVSVRDVEGGIYYAQIRGLMQDEYCEKSASLSWLIPTLNESPFAKEGFDPMTFVIGPHDDLPRKIECLEFVMHAPSDYYRSNTPFPTGLPDPLSAGYIWGRIK